MTFPGNANGNGNGNGIDLWSGWLVTMIKYGVRVWREPTEVGLVACLG